MKDSYRQHRSKIWRWLGSALTGLCLSLCASGFAIAQQHTRSAFVEPFFVAPVSGEKVSTYSVELPTKAGDRTLQVPADCAAITGLLRADKADRSRVLDRRLWFKVEHDCRYYALLHRYPRRDLRDHVSHYDFFNLPLENLPFERTCVDDDPNQCSLWLIDVMGIRQRVSTSIPTGPADDCEAKRIPCRLVNGQFRGRIHATPDGMTCLAARRASLRLLSVDYGDINGDGVLDAVLRLMQISPEEGRRILRIPLAKASSDDGFTTPAHASNAID